MKTSKNNLSNEQDDDLLTEYDLDFSQSRPNKYAAILKRQEHLVKLESDVFKVFDDSEKVNNALRSLINAMPKRSTRKMQKV